MATRERQKFTPEFKREAVKLAEQPGRPLATLARELGGCRVGAQSLGLLSRVKTNGCRRYMRRHRINLPTREAQRYNARFIK